MLKILVISKCPTHITRAGNQYGVLAQTEILKQLGCEVHFLYVQELPLRHSSDSYIENEKATAAFWGKYYHLYRVKYWEKVKFNILKQVRIHFLKNYHHVDDTYPNGLTSFVKKLNEQYHFDICIVNYIQLSKLFTKVKFPKTAIFTHDSFAYKELKTNDGCASMDAAQEAKGLQRSENLFAVQDEEAIYFKMLSPRSKVYNIYSKYDYYSQPVVDNKNIMFLSGSNQYNQNGIRWFVNEVFPLIRTSFQDTKLLIGGSICKVIDDLKSVEGVKLLGFVDNVYDFYAQGDVAINPVYQGTGLKIKTFEALSYGKVTMVHPHSMEGVFDAKNAPLFASANPDEWVLFLKDLWNCPQNIRIVKSQDETYIKRMMEYVVGQYVDFLNV
jgi:hypothetical protein